jgi:hypothetical protein
MIDLLELVEICSTPCFDIVEVQKDCYDPHSLLTFDVKVDVTESKNAIHQYKNEKIRLPFSSSVDRLTYS